MARCRGLIVAAICALVAEAEPAEPAYVVHEVNGQSEFCAAAALDVNRDGRLDIVCGGWWYEAPHWERHFVREVENIRGRFDDYSALPLDVNNDGRLDLVSCNYRSKSLYWVEQPSAPTAAWPRHLIDTPGPMETGRLADVNGDGRPDVLPNGTGFAAWWELVSPASGADAEPRWMRHDLPPEIAGHGVGFGDVNGDGRGDIVGPRGWLEAPADPGVGRWPFHGEYQLDGDASIPILVWDVDRDGDHDLVWGRGHRTGLFWLEQLTDGAARSWQRHEIDTSWSQAHSLLLADMDGDGADELVAGKRYLGHDGKDPGEYDPLVIYAYKYDSSGQSWDRTPLSEGGRAGFDLDPKAVDLDGDGDIDILAPGRSGLYWIENRLK